MQGITAAFLVGFIFNAIVISRYLFPASMIFALTLVACLAIALFGRQSVSESDDNAPSPEAS